MCVTFFYYYYSSVKYIRQKNKVCFKPKKLSVCIETSYTVYSSYINPVLPEHIQYYYAIFLHQYKSLNSSVNRDLVKKSVFSTGNTRAGL